MMFTPPFTLLLGAGLAMLGLTAAQDEIPSAVSAAIAQNNCTGAIIENVASIIVDDQVIEFRSVSCAAEGEEESGLEERSLQWLSSFWYKPPFCFLCGKCPPKPPPPPPKPTNVCKESCKLSCNGNAGILPPISEDCAMIEKAIVVMTANLPNTFVVDPLHIETLTFGTCSYFFTNLHSKTQMEYCWNALSATGKAAGANCFPPKQPFFPEGNCKAANWAVGAAHS